MDKQHQSTVDRALAPHRKTANERVIAVNAKTPQMDAGWLTMQEVAAALKVPYSRVRRWVYAGILPSHVLPGGRGRRVRASDLEAAMGEPAEGKSYVH